MAKPPIRIRRSAVPGAIPTTGQLALGELAINTADGKLFLKKNDGSESIVEIGAGGGTYTAPTLLKLYNKNNSGSVASFDGVETRFQLRDENGVIISVSDALSIAISVGGVIQKPNSSAPGGAFEGFYITPNATSGTDIVFGSAPATGNSFFGVRSGLFVAPNGSIQWIDIAGTPTTLAGYGIADAQPLDADLTAIAAISGTSGLLRKTAANTWSLDTNTYLTGNQSITFTGDATGSGTTSVSLTLSNTGVSAGTYNNSSTTVTPITVDAKGRITSTGSAVTITPAFSSVTGKPTTLSGYGITDAVSSSDSRLTDQRTPTDGSVTNAKVATNAAIAGTKISPDFGSQNVTTTGVSTAAGFIPTSSTVPTNGVYLPAANSVGISTNGSGRLFVDSSGRVGVNYSAPGDGASRFQVEGNIGLGGGDETQVLSIGRVDSGATNPMASISMFGNGANDFKGAITFSTNSAGFFNSPCSERMRITSAGLVGIGTSAPNNLLCVGGNTPTAGRISSVAGVGGVSLALSDNTNSSFYVKHQAAGVAVIGTDGGGALGFATDGFTEKMRLDSSGRLGIGTTSPATLLDLSSTTSAKLNLTYPGFGIATIASDSTGALLLQADEANTQASSLIQFKVDGSERLRITSAGLVGIGTSSPGALVHGQITSTASTNTEILRLTDNALCDFRVFLDRGTALGNSTTRLRTANGILSFETSDTPRVTIDASGRVGIGTTSPTDGLQVANGNILIGTGGSVAGYRTLYFGASATQSARFAYIEKNNDSPFDFNIVAQNGTTAASSINFKTTPTSTAATIDSSGRLLVGTSTARSNFFNTTAISPQVQIEAVGTNVQSFLSQVRNSSADTDAPVHILAKSRGTALNTYTVVQSGDALGQISFQGADGSEFVEAAFIRAEVDGTPGANSMPGRIVLSTTASGASSPTERCRITSAGRFQLTGAYDGNITAVAALNIDCSLGNTFTKTINGNSTFTVSNVPASRSYAFTLELTHTSGTITWFSGVVWPGGTAPTLTTGKVHLFMFFTDDGGTTWRASSLINY